MFRRNIGVRDGRTQAKTPCHSMARASCGKNDAFVVRQTFDSVFGRPCTRRITRLMDITRPPFLSISPLLPHSFAIYDHCACAHRRQNRIPGRLGVSRRIYLLRCVDVGGQAWTPGELAMLVRRGRYRG